MQQNSIERRTFLSSLAAGSAAAVVGGGALPAGASSISGGASRLLHLSVADFAPHVGDRFLLQSESQGSVAVQLIEAKPVKRSADRPRELPRREAFSLVFRAPGSAQLTQDIFQVRHAALGTLGMFLVPVGPQKDTQRVEAVFA